MVNLLWYLYGVPVLCQPPDWGKCCPYMPSLHDFTFSSSAVNGVIHSTLWWNVFSNKTLKEQGIWFLLFSISILRLFCHKILGLEPSKISLGADSWSSKEGSKRMNLRQPRSPCVLQFEIHPHKQDLKSQIRQGVVLPEIPKGGVNVFLELSPMQANLSWFCCRAKISDYDDDCKYSNVQDGKDDDDCRLQWQVEKVNCHNWTPAQQSWLPSNRTAGEVARVSTVSSTSSSTSSLTSSSTPLSTSTPSSTSLSTFSAFHQNFFPLLNLGALTAWSVHVYLYKQ